MSGTVGHGPRRSPWPARNLDGPGYSQSLERGLAILASFSAERPVLGIADIADVLEMNRSTTHRYVSTLTVSAVS